MWYMVIFAVVVVETCSQGCESFQWTTGDHVAPMVYLVARYRTASKWWVFVPAGGSRGGCVGLALGTLR